MSTGRYFKVSIDKQPLDVSDARDLGLAISYRLEDPKNFQTKQSSDSRSIVVPATTANDKIANTFHNPGVEDMTPEQYYRSFRPAVIEARGYELLVGKAILTRAKHARRPISYEYDFYGNNADWIIPLKEATIYDFVKHISFLFTKETIQASWAYDGTSENLPYVFAPVRYGNPMEPWPENLVMADPPMIKDSNMLPTYMKPSLSVYWIIYWGFKSLGYRINSTFLNSDYFRRMVMPWTWGNFLTSDGTRLDNLDFLAKSTEPGILWNVSYTGYLDCHVSNDSADGAFDNNDTYDYDQPNAAMRWTYLNTFPYGILDATFHFQAAIDATATSNSDVELYLRWFKNGVQQGGDEVIVYLNSGPIDRDDFVGLVDLWKTIQVQPGDIITARIWADNFDSGLGRANVSCDVVAFELDYFRIPLGATIDFENYSGFKNNKFLEFLGGILDFFNISPQTDPINKVVTLEPMHPYSLTNNLAIAAGGYFNGNFLNWDQKQDLEKVSELELFSDSERELIFKLKDDSNDGLLKKVQDRNATVLGQGKYALPDRFKNGKAEIENRFFSPVVHCELNQWKGMGTAPDVSPQIVCLVPENISNTSRDAAQNTFSPKMCHYKGLVSHVGWKFDGVNQEDYPFMFAVNYQTGGENDPVLSYSDERIGKEGEYLMAKGLLRRFYLQRMAIMRNGQYYTTSFRLRHADVTNWLHREHIVCRGDKWELVEIRDYMPLKDQSTECFLRKWAPADQRDSQSIFPTMNSVLATGIPTEKFDLKYNPMKCLTSDLPIETE